MNERVLPWKVKTLDTHATCPKDLTMLVKPLKRII
jgi:hypothetical protein